MAGVVQAGETVMAEEEQFKMAGFIQPPAAASAPVGRVTAQNIINRPGAMNHRSSKSSNTKNAIA